jgi:drebrin-like protein
MRSLTSQNLSPSTFNGSRNEPSGPEPVRGAYQPIGKVDIAAIRAQARQSGEMKDERPEIVKGSYEPVGKVDIAAIRARAQPSSGTVAPAPSRVSPVAADKSEDIPTRSLADRSSAFSSGPERLTSLPKPKVANKFGGGSTFTGTRAPLPGAAAAAPAAPVGVASRTFADEGGKTPAQIWAEKKARERGQSGSGDAPSPTNAGPSMMTAQTSGGGEWKSGYAGKSWAPVQTTHTGKSAASSGMGQQRTGDLPTQEEQEEAPSSPAGGISSIRDRFSGAAPMGAPAPSSSFNRAAPEPDISNKPNRGIPIPGLLQESSGLPTPPPQPPRSPTPPTPEMRDTSPIRIAQPVGRGAVEDAHEEQISPPPVMPVRSIPQADEDDEPETGPDPARAAAQSTAAATMGQATVDAAPAATQGGERAKAEYDYEAAEDNEVSLREGEIVTNVEKIDPDWWVVTNEKGQSGLVPANYLSPLDGDDEEEPVSAAPMAAAAAAVARVPEAAPVEHEHEHEAVGATATAQYDYEAAEDNELSFPENATITNVVCIAYCIVHKQRECPLTCLQSFPDDDWWHGEYAGKSGLFPSNYVELQQ